MTAVEYLLTSCLRLVPAFNSILIFHSQQRPTFQQQVTVHCYVSEQGSKLQVFSASGIILLFALEMAATEVMFLPQEAERCDYPVTPSRRDERDDDHRCSVHKHRKAVSTGGGRAWTEEEVSVK